MADPIAIPTAFLFIIIIVIPTEEQQQEQPPTTAAAHLGTSPQALGQNQTPPRSRARAAPGRPERGGAPRGRGPPRPAPAREPGAVPGRGRWGERCGVLS